LIDTKAIIILLLWAFTARRRHYTLQLCATVKHLGSTETQGLGKHLPRRLNWTILSRRPIFREALPVSPGFLLSQYL